MKKTILLLTIIPYCTILFGQIDYLDLSGLSNTNSISSRAIGGSSVTFDANILNIGSPPNPQVNSIGDFSFGLNTGTEQCINISFSSAVEFYVTDNTNSGHGIFENEDSIVFDNTNYTLTDPGSQINLTNSSGTPSVTSFTVDNNITNDKNWNMTYTPISSITICGLRTTNAKAGNLKAPMRFGVTAISLPIELISFKTTFLSNKQVQLDWKTASEINNDYFVVERSKNGQVWEEISKVDGNGTTSSESSYQYIDKNPHLKISYYRLKQIDFDGEFFYTPISSVKIESSEEINLYPNPLQPSQVLNIDFVTQKESEQIIVIDQMGRTVKRLILDTQEGRNKVVLDVSDLAVGSYFIKIVGNRGSKMIQIQE